MNRVEAHRVVEDIIASALQLAKDHGSPVYLYKDTPTKKHTKSRKAANPAVDETLAQNGNTNAHRDVKHLLYRAIYHMRQRGIDVVRGTEFLADMVESGLWPVSDEELQKAVADTAGNGNATYVLHFPEDGQNDLLLMWKSLHEKGVGGGIDKAVNRTIASGVNRGTIPAKAGAKAMSGDRTALDEARK